MLFGRLSGPQMIEIPAIAISKKKYPFKIKLLSDIVRAGIYAKGSFVTGLTNFVSEQTNMGKDKQTLTSLFFKKFFRLKPYFI
jgi:protein-arginine kinase